MTPRVYKAALEILKKGPMDKWELAHDAFCDQRTAQRILKKMHEEGLVHIFGWATIYKHYIPIYSLGTGVDVKSPRIKGNTMHMRVWRRNNPEKVVAANAERKKERYRARILRQQEAHCITETEGR